MKLKAQIHITLKPSVSDPQGLTVAGGLKQLGFSSVDSVRVGKFIEIEVEADRDLFSYEADTVAKCLDARQASAMSWDDTLGNIRVLDSWLAEVGVT